MLLPRKELLDKLEVVSPALSTNELLPVLTHYWLTGETLMAFNDQIAIEVPCHSDVVGAVPGVLLSLVKNSKAREAELTHTNDNFLVRLASTRIKLAHLSKDNFVFNMPKKGKHVLIVKDRKAFFEALGVCMLSVGTDTAVTDQLGVTLLADGKSALMAFATDNASIAHARIELASGSAALKQRVILSSQFVKQVLALGPSAKNIHLEINDDYALFEVPGVRVFGRLIVSTSPIDFDDIVKRHFPAEARKQLVQIPSKLKLMLDRAVIITDSMTDQAATTVTCDGEVMKFVSRTGRGEVVETVQLPGHPSVKVRLEPKLLRVGYGKFDDMIVTERCAVMVRGDSFYMVSAFAS